METVSKVT